MITYLHLLAPEQTWKNCVLQCVCSFGAQLLCLMEVCNQNQRKLYPSSHWFEKS